MTVGRDSLCEKCFTNGIKAQFLDAIKDETKYPVKYGANNINIHDYESFFTKRFLEEWATKEKEYQIPMQERLYCNRIIFIIPAEDPFAPGSSTAASKAVCGHFVGDKRGCLSDVTVCNGCTGHLCSKRSEPLDGAKTHKCKKLTEEEDPFGKMTRGVDYQICPNESCKIKMMLWDGCNSIRCHACRTSLCFVCGKQPAPDHFSKGCPRFGKKGDSRAIHDDVARPMHDFGDMLQIPGQAAVSLEERLVDALVMQLEEIHERIFAVPDPGNPAVNPVHDLTHSITDQLQRFRTTLITPGRSFRGSRRFQDVDRAITTAAARVGEEGFQLFPGLSLIIASYRQIWADVLTEDSMISAIRQIEELADRGA